MALIQCHECRGKVSNYARTCPHCGAPVIATIKRRQKAERRFLLVKIVIVTIMAVVLWVMLNNIFSAALAPLKNHQ